YTRAYPDQIKNNALREALELTVTKEESEHIPDETVLQVLQVFGNDDLAFIVQRSEEHTSELQSRFDIVCRLLLEKKNKDDTVKNTLKKLKILRKRQRMYLYLMMIIIETGCQYA